MAKWIDFVAVKAAVSLEDVIVRFYGITGFSRDGRTLIGPCPVHGGDSPRAFHADLEKNLWHCFSRCKGGGNQLDFVAKKEGISIREAALKLQDAFMTGTQPPVPKTGTPPPMTKRPEGGESGSTSEGSGPSTSRNPGTQQNPALGITLVLSHDHPHLTEKRKLSEGTIQHFGVGYCARGILRGMVAIPIHDESGVLVAYAGRRLRPSEIREHGKYKFPKGFMKDLVLYNLHRLETRDRVVLVEGFFSVMALYERGITDAVASMGSHLSASQASLLSTFREVIVLYDGDESGRIAGQAVKSALAERTTVRVATLPAGFQPEDLEPRALRWIVNGLSQLDLAEVSLTLRSPKEKSEEADDGDT